ncbi:MAG: DUF7249 family protein [Pirellulaceae bacterium]
MNNTYNGWSNYETWCIHLWLTNDDGSNGYWLSVAEEVYENAEERSHWSQSDAARYQLADMLRDEVGEANPLDDASMFADLLGSALSGVDWSEIANAFLESVDGYETK